MPTHADFLKEILAAADDDVPRLVYADWLDEQGDPRGEFIRVECLLAQLPVDDDRRWALETRGDLLRRQFAKGWAGPLRHLVTDWRFRRGFVEHVTIRADRFLEHAAELFAAAPIKSVRLLQPETQLSAFAASPWLERIESLDLRHTRLDWHTFEDLAYSPSLIDVKELNLRDTGLCNDEGARLLAECEYLRNLTALDLSQLRLSPYEGGRRLMDQPDRGAHRQWEEWRRRAPGQPIGAATIASLAQSPNLKNLTSLNFSGHGEGGAEMIAALAESPLLGRLTSLDLSQTATYTWGEEEFQVVLDRLFQSHRTGNLRHLRLKRAYLQGEPFASSEKLNLESLHLAGTGIANEFSAIAHSQNVNRLVVLDLAGCTMDAKTIQATFTSDQFHHLQELNLNETGVGDEGVTILAESSLLENLRCLKLQGTEGGYYKRPITAQGARALAASERCRNLHVLDLGNQPLGDGVRHLLDSPNFQPLRCLGLWKTGLSDAEVPRLCDRSRFLNLELLDVRCNDLSDESKRRLRDRFGAGVRFGT